MFIRILFICTVLLASGMILYVSIGQKVNSGGVIIAGFPMLGALALMSPLYPKRFESWIDRLEAKILPKSDGVRRGLGIAIISWIFAWQMLTTTSKTAPTGKSGFILGPIYNIAGYEGIGILSIVFGAFFLWIGFRSKNNE